MLQVRNGSTALAMGDAIARPQSTPSMLAEERSRYSASGSSRMGGAASTMAIFSMVAAGTLLTLTQAMPVQEATQLSVFDIPAPASVIADIPPEEPAEQAIEKPAPPAAQVPPLPTIADILLPSAMAVAAEPPPALQEAAPEPPAKSTPPSPPPPPARNDAEARTWEDRILAALNAVRRYPRLAMSRRQQGIPFVRFVMDRTGKILSSRLERSSGFSDLDREAVALPSRASPLPAPDDDHPGRTVELVVPVEFFLR